MLDKCFFTAYKHLIALSGEITLHCGQDFNFKHFPICCEKTIIQLFLNLEFMKPS